jgi:hypothetical protein
MKNIKPIHKFNGGRGATLCHKCNRIITEGLSEDLYCEECSGVPTHKYKLIRDGDKRFWNSNEVKYVRWNEDGTFKELLEQPEVGCSIIVDSKYGVQYTWMTTTIESFVAEDNMISFRTKNSVYTLIKQK